MFIVFCCYLHTLSVSLLPTTHRQAEEKRRKRKRQVADAAKRCRQKKAAAVAEVRARAARGGRVRPVAEAQRQVSQAHGAPAPRQCGGAAAAEKP